MHEAGEALNVSKIAKENNEDCLGRKKIINEENILQCKVLLSVNSQHSQGLTFSSSVSPHHIFS